MAGDGRRVTATIEALAAWGAARDWLGADPYEGLNSPLGKLVRGKRPRQVVIQAYKRLPFDPPPPLRAAPQPNAKTVGLVLSAYFTRTGARLPGADGRRTRLRALLDSLDLRRGGGSAAWGYHFDFQSRWTFYSATTPNAIATSFVAGSLLDADDIERALPVRRFALDELWADGYFGYVPGSPPIVHNASALVCGTLARLHAVDPDDDAAERVAAAARTTIGAQREDGSWPYGAAGALGWVDNFHTAYTLDGLVCVERSGIAVDGLRDSIAAGAEFWREQMFEAGGRARYYPHETYPLDTHSYATAIEVLTEIGDAELAERVLDGALRDLWLEDEGRFAFQRHRNWLNKRAFVRWTNAPMFRALCRLVDATTARPAR